MAGETAPPPHFALRHTDGVLYRVPAARLVVEPKAPFEDDGCVQLNTVGVVRLFHAAGIWAHAMVSAVDGGEERRVLSAEERARVLAVSNVAYFNPHFVPERVVDPSSPEVLTALIELDATGCTAMLETEVARREREKATLRRRENNPRSAYSVDSRRTGACVKQAAAVRALALTLGRQELAFAEVRSFDFASDEAYDRAVAPLMAFLQRVGKTDDEYCWMHANVSSDECKAQLIIDEEESSTAHVTGRVSAVLMELLAEEVGAGAPAFLYSVAQPRSEPASLTSSPRPGGGGGGHGHRDAVYLVVPQDAVRRRTERATRLGEAGLSAMYSSADKHGARARLCVALARHGAAAPCAACHGSKTASPGDSPAVRAGDLAALRAGGTEAAAVETRWCASGGGGSKDLFDSFVCKCAHTRTQRVLGKRSSPGGDKKEA